MVERHSAHDSLSERLFDAEARLDTIIFLPAAHDGESMIDSLQDFIDDEIHKDYVANEFEHVWPNFGQIFSRFIGDDDDDENSRRATILDLLQHQCPVPFLIKIEYTIKNCVARNIEDTYPCGTYRAGWGYIRWRWLLAHTVEQACDRAIALAEDQKRKAWETCKPKKAPKRKVVSDVGL
jgi:hypothetical protein